ncbi:MAG TPA: UDP-N-acetylmuramate dehydrogenase [Bacteroidales bacterium]|nr:UDP-N-acetylmuramate dehydrogenase [Bacteroidales bacterium]
MMLRNYSLRHHNTFGLDVVCNYALKLHDAARLEELFREGLFSGEPFMVLGGGSNVLFLNDYYDGLVLLIENKGITLSQDLGDEVIVSVAAGEDWSAFVEQMVKAGLGGVENLTLIPGKVGAAPMQNIGAYGVEFKDVFHSLQAFDTQTGELVEFLPEDCEFGYRSSVFKTLFRNRFIIVGIDIRLTKSPKLHLDYGSIRQELDKRGVQQAGVEEVSAVVRDIRQSKLPDPATLGNAGSFFKNPVVHPAMFDLLKTEFPEIPGYPAEGGNTKLAAGWLIEKAGWKGYRKGDAGVYDRQALVLVNYGKATGRDLWELALEIQYSVKTLFGITLEPEVNIIS